MIGPPLEHRSRASTLNPNVVVPPSGSMRPPPVKRSPPAQSPVPSENEGLGPAGVTGRSQPHASSVAATRPGTNPSLICLHMLCLLSRVVRRTAAGGAVAIQMPVGGLQVLLVKSRVTRAVAVAQRAAGASLARRQRGARAKWCTQHGRGSASRRCDTARAPRGAACGPPPAGRCIAHSPTSWVTHTLHASGIRVSPRPAVAGWRPRVAARVPALPPHRPARNPRRRTRPARSARRPGRPTAR